MLTKECKKNSAEGKMSNIAFIKDQRAEIKQMQDWLKKKNK